MTGQHHDARAGRCPACTARVLWVTTVRGANLPLNPEPDDRHGRYIVVGGRAYRLVELVDAGFEDRAGDPRYLPHQATCRQWHDHTQPGAAGRAAHRPRPPQPGPRAADLFEHQDLADDVAGLPDRPRLRRHGPFRTEPDGIGYATSCTGCEQTFAAADRAESRRRARAHAASANRHLEAS